MPAETSGSGDPMAPAQPKLAWLESWVPVAIVGGVVAGILPLWSLGVGAVLWGKGLARINHGAQARSKALWGQLRSEDPRYAEAAMRDIEELRNTTGWSPLEMVLVTAGSILGSAYALSWDLPVAAGMIAMGALAQPLYWLHMKRSKKALRARFAAIRREIDSGQNIEPLPPGAEDGVNRHPPSPPRRSAFPDSLDPSSRAPPQASGCSARATIVLGSAPPNM